MSWDRWSAEAEIIETDVLVIGGGLAGTWAAVAAARDGAAVVLAEKGYCGTSGVTAAAGPGHWWVAPEGRAAAVARRNAAGRGLSDPDWMDRIIDLTWRTLPTISAYYDYSRDENGKVHYRALRGPEYLRAMRRLAEDSGVRILDQSPVQELLMLEDGSVGGAVLLRRQEGRAVIVRAGAVVLATGGCAFMSHLLGSHTNTGDGYLMAVEAGAELSGMEFCTYHTVSPTFSTMTRSMSYAFATYYDAAGREIATPPGRDATPVLARALLEGPVFCDLHRMPDDVRAVLRAISPNFMVPFDRRGLDPFNQRFEITLRGEGTVRGTGGLRIVGEDCRTTVPGLFAAGDAASRELIAGAISGGGNQNSAWALSSGQWAGQGAAALALSAGRRAQAPAHPLGGVGLRPTHDTRPVSHEPFVTVVQEEMLPFDKIFFRTGAALNRSLKILDDVWAHARSSLAGEGAGIARAREAAALLASARWSTAAAEARRESRGMHFREDFPDEDPRYASRLLTGGLDRVWTRFEAQPAQTPDQSKELVHS